MEEFQTYSPEEIILANLEELFLRNLQGNEQESAHLRELAEEIASEFSDNASFLASLPDQKLPLPAVDLSSAPQLRSLIEPLCYQHITRRSVLLCMELTKRIPSPDTFWQDFFPSGDEPNEFALNRISYQKNNYTEKAFQCFSKLLKEPKISYAHSFPSVCEDVYNGICEYCILPIENSSEGRLAGFVRLIAQYDLKITATCDIRIDDEKITKFALLRKNFSPLQDPLPFPRYYEFSTPVSEYPDAQDFLSAARLCGLTPEYADIKPVDSSHRRTLHTVLRTDGGNLLAFLLYLIMEAPTANSIGHYPNVSL